MTKHVSHKHVDWGCFIALLVAARTRSRTRVSRQASHKECWSEAVAYTRELRTWPGRAMTKGGPACGCFGSPRGRQPSPSRPDSVSGKALKVQTASVEGDEAWKIGTQIPQTRQPETPTPALLPTKPLDSVHGEPSSTDSLQQGTATRNPSGLSVKSGIHDASSPAMSLHKPDSSAATAIQSHSTTAAAGDSTSLLHRQQQLASEQGHDSSHTTAQRAAASTAAAAGHQPLDSSQHMQHGIPGFAAMPPAQQSAAILAKWGVAPASEVHMQQQQQQQESQDAAQHGGPTRSASAANAPGQVAANPGFTVPDGLGRSAPEGPLHQAGDSQVDRVGRMTDQDSSLGFSMTAPDAIQNDNTSHISHLGASQTGRLVHAGEQAGSVMVSEHNEGNEEGLALEQPDGEGSAPLVTPEVVRGRVVRATEMWHRQRLQQEAMLQAQQMSDDLAYLRGQNQNERLAVPLLHLAGAVQAALAWQHKVSEYSAQSLAHTQQLESLHSQPSGAARRPSVLSKKSIAGEPRRAVQQMEAQLRATRQDALQLATAVVRLEKEKAVLQTQLSGQDNGGGPPSQQQQQQGCTEGSGQEGPVSAAHSRLVEQSAAVDADAGAMPAKEATNPDDTQLEAQCTAAWAHQEQDGEVVAVADAKAPEQPAAAAANAAERAPASPRAASSSPRSKADTGRRRKPWGSSMTLREGVRGGSQVFEGSSSSSRGRAVGGQSPRQHEQPAKRGLSQSSLQLRSGISSGSLSDVFAGQQTTGSSRSEGGSPRRGASGRLPSFMDSTRCSQAHMHGQPLDAVADSVEMGVHKEPLRPSGIHVTISGSGDAAEGMSKQAQHAQQGHAELSPRCGALESAGSGSFMDSTQSSRAHHHGEHRRQPSQHDYKKDGELVCELAGVSRHHSQCSHDNEIRKKSAAGRGGEMLSDHAQTSGPNDVAQWLPQSAACELQSEPQAINRAGSMSEKGQGLVYAKRPSFMLPTASSLAHTTAVPRASLGKSVSATQM